MTAKLGWALQGAAVTLSLLLAACGGGGSDNPPTPAPTQPYSIAQVELAQTYAQVVGSTYQRLVPSKAALIRAYLVANADMASPNVSASVVGSSDPQCTLTLNGPARLPTSLSTSSSGRSHEGILPAACVQGGMALRINTDGLNSEGTAISRQVTPVVGANTNLKLVLVPLVTKDSNNQDITGQAPDLVELRQMLLKVYPLIDANLEITVRAPYRVTSSSRVNTSDEWGSALEELDDLRRLENVSKHYFGLVPLPNFVSGTVGLAYQNPSNGSNAFRSALGADAQVSFTLSTLAHELGHNFGRGHTTCSLYSGTPSSPDTSFPYSNGGLGTAQMFDALSLTRIYPSPASDVMGYCDGQWFSDYNYSGVQRFMETWLSPMQRGAEPAQNLLRIRGRIGAGGVSFAPSQTHTGSPSGSSGRWTLRVTDGAGAVSSHRFEPVAVVDHSEALEATQHFALSIAAPAGISALEVLDAAGQPLPQAQASAKAAASAASVAEPIRWEEKDGRLLLSWDATRYPSVAVSHVGARTTVLALQLRGGSASLPLAQLAPGGKWAFSLAHGFDARLIEAARAQ